MSEARSDRYSGWLAALALLLLVTAPRPGAAQQPGAADWSASQPPEQGAAAGAAGQDTPPPAGSTGAPAAEQPGSVGPGVAPADAGDTPAAPRRSKGPTEPGVSITPAMPIPMATPAAGQGEGAATPRNIQISTPPPEDGAADFDPAATGLIRTDTFEVPSDGNKPTTTIQLEGAPYQGVVPGQHDELPTFGRFAKSHQPYVTWIGFQPVGNGRVFVQLTQQAAFNLVPGKGEEWRLEIQGARLAFRNAQRAMDVSYFPGLVASIQAQHTGKGVQVLLRLKKPATPQVHQQGGYLYLDLP